MNSLGSEPSAVAWPGLASREVSEPRHPVDTTGNVAYCEVDRVLDRLDVLTLSEAVLPRI